MINLKSILGEWRGGKATRQQIVTNLRQLCVERDRLKRPKAATNTISMIADMIEDGRA